MIRDVGAHYGDLEHISIVLDATTRQIIELYYGAHSSEQGRWMKPTEVEFEGDRPVVYSALGSHASYNKPGVVFRFFGFGNDITNKGLKWDPPMEQVLLDAETGFNKTNMGWMYFGGAIGKDGVSSLAGRDFIKQGDDKNVKPPTIISNFEMTYIQTLFYTILLGLLSLYIIFSFHQKKVKPYIMILLLIFLLVILLKFTDNKLSKI
jgi:hypothetical protein